jgi:hypothetical protein
VNDGSRDGTLRIARRLESKEVKVIDQPNAGGPAARNRGLAAAQGDYIQWLDHDDLLAPNKISEQVKKAEELADDRILLSSAFGRFLWRPEKAWFTPTALWRDLRPVEYFLIKFNGNIYFQSSAWLVSRKVSGLAGPWWQLRSPDDDGEYFCRVVAASERIEFVAEARSYWRVGNYGSFSQARSKAALEAMCESTRRCIEHLLALENSERARAACVKFLQDRMSYFYPEEEDIISRMEALAERLGGTLSAPELKWKYRWIGRLLGERVAWGSARVAQRLKGFAVRNYDWLAYGVAEKMKKVEQAGVCKRL